MDLLHQKSSTMNEPIRQPQPKKHARRFFTRKRKFLAGLLAALLPGLGHIYLGLFKKGISFIFVLILDSSALLYFSSTGMHINVPFLILLGLMIPITYFYNLYDVLQAADYTITRRLKDSEMTDGIVKRRHNPFSGEGSVSFGVLLVVGGIILSLFHQKPTWLGLYIENYGQITIACGLVAIGFVLMIREFVIQRKNPYLEKGRDESEW